MVRRTFRSDAILLVTAAIWGLAFTAQRAGMEHIGPFIYTSIRFALGAIVLLPFWVANVRRYDSFKLRALIVPGISAGLMLTLGVLFQQAGLVYTTAGKAGFITGLYVVFVPILSLFLRHRSPIGSWAGAVLAAAGLYLLSIRGAFVMSRGDTYVLIGAFFWAIHVLVLARFAPKIPFIPLAIAQYAVCAVLSLIISIAVETIDFQAILDAALPILYGGAVSVGIAYTLQIVGQREAPPTHAAIILSLEGVFAAVGGLIVLGERLTPREIIGCGIMLTGMLISQLALERRGKQVS